MSQECSNFVLSWQGQPSAWRGALPANHRQRVFLSTQNTLDNILSTASHLEPSWYKKDIVKWNKFGIGLSDLCTCPVKRWWGTRTGSVWRREFQCHIAAASGMESLCPVSLWQEKVCLEKKSVSPWKQPKCPERPMHSLSLEVFKTCLVYKKPRASWSDIRDGLALSNQWTRCFLNMNYTHLLWQWQKARIYSLQIGLLGYIAFATDKILDTLLLEHFTIL